MTELTEAWDQLGELWQLAFAQAWAAYQDGCCPVGALLLDPAGAVVAQARNRVRASHTRSRELADTKIAHAALNALVQIPTATEHIPTSLYLTFEPCQMCLGATVLYRIQHVHFGSADFFAGATALTKEPPAIAELGPRIHGPLNNSVCDLFLHLYIAYHAWQSPAGPIAQAYALREPAVYSRANSLAELLEPFRISAQTPLISALHGVSLDILEYS